MENTEIFDRNGNVLNLSEFIRNFLKDNLSVQISTNRGHDFGNEFTVVEVSVLLNGEEISQSSDTIR